MFPAVQICTGIEKLLTVLRSSCGAKLLPVGPTAVKTFFSVEAVKTSFSKNASFLEDAPNMCSINFCYMNLFTCPGLAKPKVGNVKERLPIRDMREGECHYKLY